MAASQRCETRLIRAGGGGFRLERARSWAETRRRDLPAALAVTAVLGAATFAALVAVPLSQSLRPALASELAEPDTAMAFHDSVAATRLAAHEPSVAEALVAPASAPLHLSALPERPLDLSAEKAPASAAAPLPPAERPDLTPAHAQLATVVAVTDVPSLPSADRPGIERVAAVTDVTMIPVMDAPETGARALRAGTEPSGRPARAERARERSAKAEKPPVRSARVAARRVKPAPAATEVAAAAAEAAPDDTSSSWSLSNLLKVANPPAPPPAPTGPAPKRQQAKVAKVAAAPISPGFETLTSLGGSHFLGDAPAEPAPAPAN